MASSWILILKVLLVGLFGQALGVGPLIAQEDWLLPEYPDNTTTFIIGKIYKIQWNSDLETWFKGWCAKCDPSNVDLWVQTGQNEDSQYKIAGKRRISYRLAFCDRS